MADVTVISKMTYQIQDANNGEIIASNLDEDGLAAWWAENEDEYFGVRVVGDTIVVVDAE